MRAPSHLQGEDITCEAGSTADLGNEQVDHRIHAFRHYAKDSTAQTCRQDDAQREVSPSHSAAGLKQTPAAAATAAITIISVTMSQM